MPRPAEAAPSRDRPPGASAAPHPGLKPRGYNGTKSAFADSPARHRRGAALGAAFRHLRGRGTPRRGTDAYLLASAARAAASKRLPVVPAGGFSPRHPPPRDIGAKGTHGTSDEHSP